MTVDQARRIRRKLLSHGINSKLYEDYSGKGMFGDKTLGVVIDPIDFPEEVCPSLKKFRADNLGMQTIYY